MMHYHDGSQVLLGDTVLVPVPSGQALGCIVMLGDTRDHLDIDPQFLSWVASTDVLRSTAIVVRWIGENPFAHDDPALAPVGNYMFMDVDEWVELQSRAEMQHD